MIIASHFRIHALSKLSLAAAMMKHWDVKTGDCLDQRCDRVWLAHDGAISSLAISPDGSWLASASDDKRVKIWDLATGDCLKVLQGHSDRVRAVVITPDGSKLISGGFDQTLRIWDTKTGECGQIIRPPRPYEGMDITGVRGLTEAEKATLKALGAIEEAGGVT